ncbi:HNH endonuclease [Pseudomonas chlororaphis]|uniref:HNH nuclease domain-containing protein n=1 Tax=Pseudomonas chlororaphis O6 TaxID=1037915 RepID=A0AB33WKG9_9PSED|nr:hypothetical protein PchlO6_5032 [Pseudomonas chlororaphis O6]
MPIINDAVTLSEEALSLIQGKMQAEDFSHESWSDEDLLPVRREIREFYRNAQRLVCVYCLGPVSNRSAAGAPIEHIVPKSQHPGFMFEPKNLCVICPDCNEYKSKRETLADPVLIASRVNYPTNTDLFRIVHPHYDEYHEHIFKCERLYVECSDKGGYTIYACNLNRFYRRFGRCDELVNDVALVQQSERFYEEGVVAIQI